MGWWIDALNASVRGLNAAAEANKRLNNIDVPKGDTPWMREYKSIADANKDIVRQAREGGWVPMQITTTDGHINVGRTTSAAILTGGASLLFGGSRSRGKVTVMYGKE